MYADQIAVLSVVILVCFWRVIYLLQDIRDLLKRSDFPASRPREETEP